MAVSLKLQRFGRKKAPFYRIVAADRRAPRDGRYIECIGYYDPRDEEKGLQVNQERALYWLRVGAQPTDTVKALLKHAGVYQQFMEEKLARKIEKKRKEKEKKLAKKQNQPA